jgi:hypothetical protein
MASATPATWLFRKEHETIWIVRPEAYLLLMFGPGSVRKQYRFGGDAEMQLFQVTLTENLSSTGWVLWGTDRDRRRGERRSAGRNSADRRIAPQPPDTTISGQRVQL